MWYTGNNVLQALENDDYSSLKSVVLLPEPHTQSLFAHDGSKLDALPRVDVFFPVTHGTFGEDGTLQGLFEMADVAYVGCGVLASAVGMDKCLFKDVMRSNAIPVVDSILVSRSEITSSMDTVIRLIEQTLTYPVFVKPANLGSSVGITKCKSRSDVYEGLLEASQYDRRVLVERGVNAREIEVSVLGNENPIASTPGEIRPSDDFYTYEAKYLDDDSELIIPARIDEQLAHTCKDMALRAYKAIDGAGMARVDFLLDRETQEIFLSEVNTIPGFTRISMYPKLLQFEGISYEALVEKLIQYALERKLDRDHTLHTYGRNA